MRKFLFAAIAALALSSPVYAQGVGKIDARLGAKGLDGNGATNGQQLVWSSSLGKWVPTTVSSGSLSGITNSTAGQLAIDDGKGSITHLLGPTDENLKIAAASAGASSGGRALVMESGPGGAVEGSSGALTLQVGTPGPGDGNAGTLGIYGAAAVAADRFGSAIQALAGDSTGTAKGGNLSAYAGNGGSTSGDGGNFSGFSGAGGGSGTGGQWNGGSGSGGTTGSGGPTNLTAGAAGSSATNGNGGKTTIASGAGTGTGTSTVAIRTSHSVTSGTGAQALGDRLVIPGLRKDLADNTATTFCLLSTSTNTCIGGVCFYTVRVTDSGGAEQTTSGSFYFAATNKAGSVTVTKQDIGTAAANLVTGTDAITTAVTNSGTNIALRITSDTSLTQVLHDVTYTIIVNGGATTVSPQ